MLTTSVAEGFGLVFLEAWLTGKRLIGRDLPEITADFRPAGLRLDDLRPRLGVPLEWIGAADWQDQIAQAYGETLARFGRRSPPPSEFRRALDALVVDGAVDFGSLTSRQQQQVIEQVAESDERRRQLRRLNDWIEIALQQERTCGPVVEENAAVVRRVYSLDACGRRLIQLYRAVADSPRTVSRQPFACRTDLGRVSPSCQVSTDSRRVMTEQCREIIRRHSRPLAPLPTGQSPVLRAMGPLDAVLFDVYGTLLVSASGDVGVRRPADRGEAIAAALAAVGMPLRGPADAALDVFLGQIEREHRDRAASGRGFSGGGHRAGLARCVGGIRRPRLGDGR